MNVLNAQMRRFNMLMTEIDSAYHKAAQKLGLSDSAMLILYTVCSGGGESMLSEVAACLGKQTANSALRKLEADGTIRTEAADGKKKKLILTDSGSRLAEETVSRVIRIENEIFDSWSDEDKEAYIELTSRYLTMFKDRLKEL